MSGLSGNPDALLLGLFAGILLIYGECNRPGMILPGCTGGLLFLLSLHALCRLPLEPLALIPIAAGLLLILAEILIRARGVLVAFGSLCLTYGLVHLLRPSAPRHVHLLTAMVAGAGFAVISAWLGSVALQARRNKFGYRVRSATEGRTG